jgi:hypothetical protein
MHSTRVARIVLLMGRLSRSDCYRGACSERQDEQKYGKPSLPVHRIPRSAGSFREYHDTFSEDARRKPDRQALDLGVRIGEYYGVVRVSRHEFQCLLPEWSTLERWVVVCYLQRTRFESIAEDATPAALDRGRECRDRRTGFVLALALVVKEGL